MKSASLVKKTVCFLVLLSLFISFERNTAEAAYTFQAKVTADVLNVRSNAGTSYGIVGKLSKGQVVTVSEQKNGWSKISYGTITGWVSSTYLSPFTWTGYVNATSLNLRSSANGTSSIIAALPRGTALTVQGTDSGWLKVYVPSKNLTGWVSAAYVSKTAPITVYPKVVLKENTSLRKGPGTTYAILSSEAAGTFYDKIAQKDGWIQVKKTNGTTGWIVGTLLRDPASVLKGKVIVLDPGHGGIDSGTKGSLIWEKTLNLRTAQEIAPLLQKAGAKVIFTRSTDIYLSLALRVNVSNTNLADAFLSLHYNSFSATSTGIMTFYYNYTRDSALAKSMQKGLVAQTKLKDMGAKFGDYHVLRENKRPSALLELGFLSNPYEEKVLVSSTYQKNAAQGIYNGLFSYFLNK